MKVRVFAFKPDAYRSHRTARHGVLFLYNGQLHASYPTRFFSRQSVRKSYLANDLLVTVDCSSIARRDFEELFMNSEWTNYWDRTGPTNGVARFRWDTGTLPPSLIKPGDSFDFAVAIADESRVDRLENSVKVNIIEPITGGGGGGGNRERGGAEAVASPNIYEVYENEWESHAMGPFDSKTAVRIAVDSSNASAGKSWDFFVNVDNEYIHHHSRRKNQPLAAARKAFSTATVFLALAIIRGELSGGNVNVEDGQTDESLTENLPSTVDRLTRFIAPVLLPVIDSLAIGDTGEPSG